jgi:hypothetical protein
VPRPSFYPFPAVLEVFRKFVPEWRPWWVKAARYISEHQDQIAPTFRAVEQALVEAAADASREIAALAGVSKSNVAALSAATATKLEEVAEAVDKIASKPPSK